MCRIWTENSTLRGSTGATSIRIFCRILLPCPHFAQNVISASVDGTDYLPWIVNFVEIRSVLVRSEKMLAKYTEKYSDVGTWHRGRRRDNGAQWIHNSLGGTKQSITSVSETIRKPPLVKIQTALRTRGQSNLTKSASRGPIPRLGVTPGGRKLYHWIPGVGFPISIP